MTVMKRAIEHALRPAGPAIINDDGVKAFRAPDVFDFPTRVIYYNNSVYMVPDWSVHHDHGDEDDGEEKLVAMYLKERGL